jgi:hypothetical protein
MMRRAKKPSLLILSLTLLFVVSVVAACAKAKPESLTITNSAVVVSPGSFDITAQITPAEASQEFTVSLKEEYPGISVSGKTVTVSEDAAHEMSFTVVATSVAAPTVSDEKTFIVDNPPPIPGVAITNGSLFVDISSSNTFQILYDCIPKDAEVEFSLLDEVEGVSIDEQTGLVTIDPDINNKVTFVAVIVMKDDETLNDQKQFTIINEKFRPISNEAELRALWTGDNPESRARLNNFYRLTNDIELTQDWYVFMGVQSDKTVGFAGTFDGNGYAIRNFNYPNAGWNAGFFSCILPGGVVKNLSLIGGEVGLTSAGGCCGAVAGYMFGTLENLYVDVDITQTHPTQWVGALYGASYDGAAGSKVINCISVGQVTATSGRSGLIGSLDYNISNVFTNSFALLGTVNYIVGETSAEGAAGYAQILSEAKLKTAKTYADWDTDIWFIANGTYPLLKHEGFVPPDLPDLPDIEVTNTTSVTELDYEIESQRTLQVTYTTEPAGKEVTFALEKPVTGVSISDTGLITLSSDVNNRASFTVVITAKENEFAFDSFTITVKNEMVREINSAEQLMALSGSKDVLYNNYILMADIVLTSGWRAIGAGVGSRTVDDGYHGTFDGNGYTISNLNMEADPWNGGFFFTIASDGVVKNLKLVGGEVGVKTIIGGALAGTLWGRIENCYVDVKVTSNHASQPSGAIAGTVCAGYRIVNCISVGQVTSTSTDARKGTGFIGTGSKDGIINSFVLNTSVDAVVGFDKVTDAAEPVTSCIKSDSELRNASTYAEWDTDIWYIIDGFYPSLKYPGWTEPKQVLTITNTETTIDYAAGQTTLQITYTIVPTGDVVFSLEEPVTGVSIDQNGLVTLTSQVGHNVTFTVVVTSATDSSVVDTKVFTVMNKPAPTKIYTQQDLAAISENLSGDYILMNDIVLTGNWTQIGNADSTTVGFSGTFDGNGYTISNINMPNAGWNNGFFGTILSTGVVKNVRFEAALVKGVYCGIIAGRNYGTIENCFVSGNIESTHTAQPAGGIVGTLAESAIIRNCLFVGTVSAPSLPDTAANGKGLIASGSKNGIVNSFALDTGVEYVVGYNKVGDGGTFPTSILKTDEQLRTAATYNGWDTSIWNIADGSYATLKKGCTLTE